METLGNQNKPKTSRTFLCKYCNYNTSKKSNYDTHMSTRKHLDAVNGNVLETNGNQNKPKTSLSNYECEICYKEFKNRSGLWKHKLKCISTEITTKNEPSDKDLIMMLIKENADMKSMMMKVIENGTCNNSNNTTTNSHNKAFNLQFFLNETCKDAMNMTDFIDSIQLQLCDLEKMAGKNARLLQVFKEKHPDYNQYHSKYSTQYNKLVIEAFGGKGDNDLEKEDKIIRNITKTIVVEK